MWGIYERCKRLKIVESNNWTLYFNTCSLGPQPFTLFSETEWRHSPHCCHLICLFIKPLSPFPPVSPCVFSLGYWTRQCGEMQRICCTPPTVACQTETISCCLDGAVGHTKVFCIIPLQPYLSAHYTVIGSKLFHSRKTENDAVKNKFFPLLFHFTSQLSPDVGRGRKCIFGMGK